MRGPRLAPDAGVSGPAVTCRLRVYPLPGDSGRVRPEARARLWGHCSLTPFGGALLCEPPANPPTSERHSRREAAGVSSR